MSQQSLLARCQEMTRLRKRLKDNDAFNDEIWTRHRGGAWTMIRGLLVTAPVAAAASGAASAVESTGWAMSPVVFTASCLPDDYRNTDVICVPSPTPTLPPGATYQCRDGC